MISSHGKVMIFNTHIKKNKICVFSSYSIKNNILHYWWHETQSYDKPIIKHVPSPSESFNTQEE